MLMVGTLPLICTFDVDTIFHAIYKLKIVFNLNLQRDLFTIKCSFLDASSHLYKRVCPSVCPSVRPSVRP